MPRHSCGAIRQDARPGLHGACLYGGVRRQYRGREYREQSRSRKGSWRNGSKLHWVWPGMHARALSTSTGMYTSPFYAGTLYRCSCHRWSGRRPAWDAQAMSNDVETSLVGLLSTGTATCAAEKEVDTASSPERRGKQSSRHCARCCSHVLAQAAREGALTYQAQPRQALHRTVQSTAQLRPCPPPHLEELLSWRTSWPPASP